MIRTACLLLCLLYTHTLLAITYEGNFTFERVFPKEGRNGPEVSLLNVFWELSDDGNGLLLNQRVQWYMGESFFYKEKRYNTGDISRDALDKLRITKLKIRTEIFADGRYVKPIFLELTRFPIDGGTWSDGEMLPLSWDNVFPNYSPDSAREAFMLGVEFRNTTLVELVFKGFYDIETDIQRLDQTAEAAQLIERGNQAYNIRNYGEAIKLFKQAEKFQPQNLDLKNQISSCQYMLLMEEGTRLHGEAQYRNAIAKYKEASAIFPNEPEPLERVKVSEAMLQKETEYKQMVEKLTAEYKREADNISLGKQQSLEKAASSFSQSAESCNMEHVRFYECMEGVYQQKQTVAIEEARALVYNDVAAQIKSNVPDRCQKPSCGQSDDMAALNSANSDAYLQAAKRKWQLFQSNKNSLFKKASEDFLASALAKDSENAAAYLFRTQFHVDVADKMVDIHKALTLNADYREAQEEFRKLERLFYDDVFDKIQKGDVPYIRRIINEGLLDKLEQHKGKTPIQFALEADQAEILYELLDRPANPAIRTATVSTQDLLLQAAEQNKVKSAKVLMEKGADPNLKGGMPERSPLEAATQAGSQEVVNLFLGQNSETAKTSGSIIIAIKTGNYALTKTFLESGADVNKTDPTGNNLLMIAIKQQASDIVNLCLEYGAEVNHENHTGETPLVIATYKESETIIEKLVGSGSNTTKAMQVLHARRPNTTKFLSRVLMHIAIGNSDISLAELAIKYHPKIATDQHSSGENYILYALYQNKIPLAERLLETDFDPNLPMNGAKYLLLEAVKVNAISMVQKMVKEKKVSLEVMNEDKQYALHIAAKNDYRILSKFLIAEKHPLDSRDKNRNMPIHIALEKRHIDIAEALINAGSSLTSPNDRDLHPIHYAAMCNSIPIVEKILKAGVDVNLQGESGMTPLHFAVDRGDLEMTNFLIQQGADPKAKDFFDRTPAKIAKLKKNKELAKLLK